MPAAAEGGVQQQRLRGGVQPDHRRAAAFSLVYAGLAAVGVAVAQSAEGPAVDPDAKARVTLAVGLLLTAKGLAG